jgi:hypothetical protein
MNRNFRKILAYAQQSINTQLRNYQEQIILADRFGTGEAVLQPDVYHPADQKRNQDLFRKLEEDYKDLHQFAKTLETFTSHMDDKDFAEKVKQFFGHKL